MFELFFIVLELIFFGMLNVVWSFFVVALYRSSIKA